MRVPGAELPSAGPGGVSAGLSLLAALAGAALPKRINAAVKDPLARTLRVDVGS